MANTRIRRWLGTLSWPQLAAFIVGAMAATFALNCVFWWLAHQLAWWTYALACTLGLFGRFTVTSTIEVLRERRKPKLSPVQRAWLP